MNGNIDGQFNEARTALKVAHAALNRFLMQIQDETNRTDYEKIGDVMSSIASATGDLDQLAKDWQEEAAEAAGEKADTNAGSVAHYSPMYGEGIAVARGKDLKQLTEETHFTFDKHMDAMFRGE